MKQKKGRKLLGVLLALVLVLGLLSGMSLTAYAAEVESEEFTTNTGAGTYTGTHIKITGTANMDTDGDYIGNSTPWTIQGLSGETITRVDMTIGYYGGDGNVSHFRANHGTLSNINDTNNGGFSFINVNSTSITIDCEGNQYALQIKKVVVYYSAGSSYSVTITAGDHMTKTTDSGAASQTGLSGAMTDVVYTANDGYYFPTDYSVAAVNGISVTRDSYTQITVSGTPTADAEITLTAPTAKTTPDAPTTAAATDCTTADNNDGKLTGVTTAMEYKKSVATDWIAGTGSDITGLVPGTYYVRVKATDTTNASAYQELTIKGFISYTVTFKVVNGKWNEGEGDAATSDKTVTLTGHDGDTLKLTAGQIPSVGSKPNDTYKAGSWDVTPSADTEITGATTYTYTYAQKDSISQTVTFKVVNGKWDDDSTEDKTVTLTGYEGDTLKLTADQIPAVGSKPNDTYKAGSWDVTPSTDTAITAATTYTYTYAAKEASVVTKAPEAKTLTYTGSAQELVTAGEATGGEMQYALGNATEATQPYTTSIPTKTDAGTYYVWYKVKGDDGYSDTEAKCIEVTISRSNSSPAISDVALPYTGQPQPLVTAGTVEGGTMYYALGEDETTAPDFYLDEAKTQIDTETWSTSVPEGTDAGTYYVWYIVKGDENHNDSEPKCVESTIAKKGLTVTADAKSKTVGEADPALTYTAEGLVAGNTLTGALSREAGEDPGTYAITLGTLTAGDNYAITFIPAALTIKEAPAPAPDPGPAPAPAPSGGGSGGGGGYYGGGAIQNQRRDAYSDVIGAAATSFRDSSPERIRNIELACEKLDGIVLQPGEVFSFNEAVGGLTAEAGFAVAPVNPDDEATAEMGGGVSQVASTLYTGSLFALLETVERTNHPYAVPFIQPGTDAYVTDPGNADALDLKFRNTRGEPIRISAKTRVDEARQVREIVIELQSALGSSDYMPIRFDNTWGGDQNAFLTATPYDLTRPGYRILLTHEEQQFTDASGAGIRTLTHRKILDAAGMLVRDEILNSKLPDGSYAMDTYYQG